MRFLVIGRAIDALPVPPEQALGAYKTTFELLAAGKDSRIKEVYPYADDRATALVVEAETAEDLDDCLSSLPGYMLSTWEAHPVTSVEHVVEAITRIERQFARR